MGLKKLLAISGIITLGLGLGVLFTVALNPGGAHDRIVAGAISGLWSANDAERQAAKEKLIQSGEASVDPLIDLLKDVITNPAPRYLHGKENEVAKINERLRLLPAENQSERMELIVELGGLEISYRLNSDTCELLGRLRAQKAIPILIEAMETDDAIGNRERMTPAMNALVEIGPAALPKVIEALETAESKASATAPGDDNKPSEFFIRTETLKIRARVTMVLGDMGDARALPVLEELLNKNSSGELNAYIREAIEKIRKSK